MAEPRCVCHDMLVEDCTRLRGAETREEEERRAEAERHSALVDGGHAIRSRFPGQCAVCGEHFEVGTPISLDKRVTPPPPNRVNEVRWAAACCLDERGRQVSR